MNLFSLCPLLRLTVREASVSLKLLKVDCVHQLEMKN